MTHDKIVIKNQKSDKLYDDLNAYHNMTTHSDKK
jgi:hypothetical protein